MNLEVEFYKDGGVTWKGIPIIASNMSTIGTFEVARILSGHKMLTALHKFYRVEHYKDHAFTPYFVMPTCGLDQENVERTDEILKYCPEIRFICLDVANGYIPNFVHVIKYFREKYPNKFLIAGNTVTADICSRFHEIYGVDFVKVGIGSGGNCLTRLVTGVGYPQFSAVEECSAVANIVSDGGCVHYGDIAKAFGGGASMVMIGSMLANHDETGNRVFGMSSKAAMIEHYEGKYKSYRAPEGREVVFDEGRGPLDITIKNILGGLRSTLTYVGITDLERAIRNMRFVRVNRTHNDHLEKQK